MQKQMIDRRHFVATASPFSYSSVMGMTIVAVEAGKDVYLEKLMADTIEDVMIGQAAHASCGRANLTPAVVPETSCMGIEYPGNYMAIFTVGHKAMRYSGMLDQLTKHHGSKARFNMGREPYALYCEDPIRWNAAARRMET